MLYMFTFMLYAFSQWLYHVCADFAQHIPLVQVPILLDPLYFVKMSVAHGEYSSIVNK